MRTLLLLFMAVGCLSHLTVGEAAEGTGAQNPCALLTASEVESVLGEPLAGPPFRVNGYEPTATGAACRYETSDFRAVTVEVDWTDGGMAFGMMGLVSGIADAGGLKGLVTLSDGGQLRGAWDQAGMFMCCQFNALSGDRRVMVDISATNLTEKDAGALADKAVQRLDRPLDVPDDLGLAEATALDKIRPEIRPACALVARAEAESLLGTALLADPEGDENQCTYTWTPAGADYQEQIKLMVNWRGGFSEMRTTGAAIGMGLGMLAEQGLDLSQDQDKANPLFDAWSSSIIGVMAVRKDVFLSIESGPMSDMAAQFLTAAAKKL